MTGVAVFEALSKHLAGGGIFSAVFEPAENLLVIHLAEQERVRLLADEPLRQDLVRQAQALGFSRCVLQLF